MQVIWVDLLTRAEFEAGFGSHTPMFSGQTKCVRYYMNFERALRLMKEVIAQEGHTFDANNKPGRFPCHICQLAAAPYQIDCCCYAMPAALSRHQGQHCNIADLATPHLCTIRCRVPVQVEDWVLQVGSASYFVVIVLFCLSCFMNDGMQLRRGEWLRIKSYFAPCPPLHI